MTKTVHVPVRACGTQGLQLSAQGLGCMGMSGAYLDKAAPASEEESIATIHRALELGVSHLDTSDLYGPHKNEILVGKAVKGERGRYTIATKFGVVVNEQGLPAGVSGTRAYVRSAVEASLERLGVDCIDLYYQHRVDRTLPIEETWAELKALVEEGKVKYLGISEASAEEIRRAHAVHPVSAVQLEWSLWTRNAEEDVIPACRELGIGIVAYSPLGRGFLTGSITSADSLHEKDWRVVRMPRFKGDALKANLELVEKVRDLAIKKGVTPGQLALAWVHAQGDDVFPIPGTKRVKYLEENVAALSVRLSAEDKEYLEATFAPEKVTGDRYDANTSKLNFEGAKKTAVA